MPSWVEQVVHAEQRAERVAVGALVGGEQEAVAARISRRHRLDALGHAGGVAHRALPLLVVVEQLGDAHAPLDGVVVVEGQGRRALHADLGGDRRLEHAVGGAQPCERRLALLLGAEHADEDLRGAQVGACLDGSHGHESDARVAEVG